MNTVNKYNIKDRFSAVIVMESKINHKDCRSLATLVKVKVKRLIDCLEKSKYVTHVKDKDLFHLNLVSTAKEKD